MTVEGPGSAWTSSSTLYVGNAGSGAMTIASGGSVTASRDKGALRRGRPIGILNIGAATGQPATGRRNGLAVRIACPARAPAPSISGTPKLDLYMLAPVIRARGGRDQHLVRHGAACGRQFGLHRTDIRRGRPAARRWRPWRTAQPG